MSHYDEFETEAAKAARDWQNHCRNFAKNAEKDLKMATNPVIIPGEMFEFVQVLYNSANSGKYPANNWLEKDGINSDLKSMHASMFRHLAESSSGHRKDKDSGLDPLLHLACRAMMCYTRIKKDLNSKDDM